MTFSDLNTTIRPRTQRTLPTPNTTQPEHNLRRVKTENRAKGRWSRLISHHSGSEHSLLDACKLHKLFIYYIHQAKQSIYRTVASVNHIANAVPLSATLVSSPTAPSVVSGREGNRQKVPAWHSVFRSPSLVEDEQEDGQYIVVFTISFQPIKCSVNGGFRNGNFGYA
jgi:hypothetical protein